MSRVFIVNEPLKFRDGEYGRAIDLRPAQKYGKLVFLSPAGEPPLDPTAWLPRMHELLETFNANKDYLLPVGHPALIVAAAAIIGYGNAMPEHGMEIGPLHDGINVLVWQGREVGYAPVRLPLFPPPENHPTLVHPQSQENP